MGPIVGIMLSGRTACRADAPRSIDHSPAELQRRFMCSWCHALVWSGSTPRTYCPTCGHRADVPRADCDCPKCWKPDDVAADYSTAQVDDWLARR